MKLIVAQLHCLILAEGTGCGCTYFRLLQHGRKKSLYPLLIFHYIQPFDCFLAEIIVIMQWVILAVRNLCENNVGNQKVIATLTQQGVVDSSVLKEMGLTLHQDGNHGTTAIPLDTLKALRKNNS